MSTALELVGVSAAYSSRPVLHDFSLSVGDGELVALLGPSGSGKTTALKLIAGLLQPATGYIRFDGKSVLETPAELRGAAMVFQKPLLFPYLSVAENVEFGLRMRKVAPSEARSRVAMALQMVQLEGLEARRPNELSGGQEQRVALARALVIEPKLLLLDEPFSALDETLRAEMGRLVCNLQRKLQITTVFVTHKQEEAATMADRIALLLDGTLEQFSAPRDFYTQPKTVRVALFFGWQSIDGKTVFRPEDATLEPSETGNAKVESVVDLGIRLHYLLSTPRGTMLRVEIANTGDMLAVGTKVAVQIPIDRTRQF